MGARLRIAMVVKAGLFRSGRMLKRTSCQRVCIDTPRGGRLQIAQAQGIKSEDRYGIALLYVSGNLTKRCRRRALARRAAASGMERWEVFGRVGFVMQR
jgi:hypothetical protein